MTTMTVIGRLGTDGQLKQTAQGAIVTELAIAYNYGRKEHDGKRSTQWVRASLWGRQAEALVPYLSKGKGVIVTLDDVHVRDFIKQDGSSGYALQGNVIKFEFSPGGKESNPQSNYSHQQQNTQPPAIHPTSGMGNANDDIPFDALFVRKAHFF